MAGLRSQLDTTLHPQAEERNDHCRKRQTDEEMPQSIASLESPASLQFLQLAYWRVLCIHRWRSENYGFRDQDMKKTRHSAYVQAGIMMFADAFDCWVRVGEYEEDAMVLRCGVRVGMSSGEHGHDPRLLEEDEVLRKGTGSGSHTCVDSQNVSVVVTLSSHPPESLRLVLVSCVFPSYINCPPWGRGRAALQRKV